MSDEWVHPLRVWRRNQANLPLDACASFCRTSRQVWCDWETGRRMPRSDGMDAIYKLTRGAIDANIMQWPQGLPDLETRALPFNDHRDPAPLLERAA